jgi:hypothetical protein
MLGVIIIFFCPRCFFYFTRDVFKLGGLNLWKIQNGLNQIKWCALPYIVFLTTILKSLIMNVCIYTNINEQKICVCVLWTQSEMNKKKCNLSYGRRKHIIHTRVPFSPYISPLWLMFRWYTTQQIMNEFVFFEKNQRFLLNFGALSPNLFLGQVPEIILRNTEIALFEWLGKETTRYFTKSK